MGGEARLLRHAQPQYSMHHFLPASASATDTWVPSARSRCDTPDSSSASIATTTKQLEHVWPREKEKCSPAAP